MSALQTLKTFIHQRLAVAVDEILGLVETTVQNYEEEIQRQRKIIESERTQLFTNNNNAVSQQTMRFRVIIGEDAKKITFENGLPYCVEDFTQVVKQAFSLDNICLHYKDVDFDDFFTLTSTGELKDKDTLKVVQLSPNAKRFNARSTPAQNTASGSSDVNIAEDIPSIELPDLPILDSPVTFNSKSQLNIDLQDHASSNSEDAALSLNIANITSNYSPDVVTPFPATSRKLWPHVFTIPSFSYTSEIVLRNAHDQFLKDGTILATDQRRSIKSDILQRLAETVFMYTAYPNDAQKTIACQALIKKHPCLKEPGSVTGYDGWLNSLRFKFGNYRSKLKAFGSSEVLINSMKHKQDGDRTPARNVKKPRKSEVNFLPQLPIGETVDSLEVLRMRLVEAHRNKAGLQTVNHLMTRTYSYRRQEVVSGSMKTEEIKERWPALFDPVQINEEFKRCNTIPLESTFISQLDKYIPKLLSLFSSTGGALGQRLKMLWLELVQDPTASAVRKRDVVLRCVIEYMGEHVHDLISDYSGISEAEVLDDLSSDSLRIYVCGQPEAVGVVIDGTVVLTGLDSLCSACYLLLGLMYALNIDYPPALTRTFEVFQRLFVGLDTIQPKPSFKYINLKNKLLTSY